MHLSITLVRSDFGSLLFPISFLKRNGDPPRLVDLRNKLRVGDDVVDVHRLPSHSTFFSPIFE